MVVNNNFFICNRSAIVQPKNLWLLQLQVRLQNFTKQVVNFATGKGRTAVQPENLWLENLQLK